MRSDVLATNPRFELDQTGDQELVERLTELVARERSTLADVLCHLAEVDARKLYLYQGCSSIFVYATQMLGLSEAASYHRIRAARVARRHPEVFDDIAAGLLHVSGLCVLAPHLDGVGSEALLDAARGQPTSKIRELVAAARPEPAVPDAITPVGEGRVVVRFTAGKALRDKLEEAQALLCHSVPDGQLGQLFERALDALIEKTRKRRFAETEAPRSARPSGRRTRHIPAAVRRAVAQRDQGRCTFVGEGGRRCDARGFTQLHHDDPYARGGEHSAANVRVLCAGHNALLAEAEYGQEHMETVSAGLASKRVDGTSEAARTMRAEVKSGLVNLGFRTAEAARAVAAVAAKLDDDVAIEKFIVEALRQLA
jgi:hypothetical protein